MPEFIIIGDEVEANRDLPQKGVSKGDRGRVTMVRGFDSESYFDIQMDKGVIVAASSENCWNKVKS